MPTWTQYEMTWTNQPFSSTEIWDPVHPTGRLSSSRRHRKQNAKVKWLAIHVIQRGVCHHPRAYTSPNLPQMVGLTELCLSTAATCASSMFKAQNFIYLSSIIHSSSPGFLWRKAPHLTEPAPVLPAMSDLTWRLCSDRLPSLDQDLTSSESFHRPRQSLHVLQLCPCPRPVRPWEQHFLFTTNRMSHPLNPNTSIAPTPRFSLLRFIYAYFGWHFFYLLIRVFFYMVFKVWVKRKAPKSTTSLLLHYSYW